MMIKTLLVLLIWANVEARTLQKILETIKINSPNIVGWSVFDFLPDFPFLQMCSSDRAERVNTSLLWTAILINMTVQRRQKAACFWCRIAEISA